MRELASTSLVLLAVCAAAIVTGAQSATTPATAAPPAAAPPAATERHLKNIRQLTFGGENAEAYFSDDGKRLIFQSTRAGYPCDQIYTVNVDGTGERRVSTGAGRTTCGYFYPGGTQILFASTHEAGLACPPRPSYARGYVWPLYPGYDIYRASADGTGITPLTRTAGYDAEATIAPDGLIVFTSVRDGDMEIYSMRADGSEVKRLTNRPGPDGTRLIFASNQHDPKGRNFDIYLVGVDGSGLQRVTFNDTFDGFPMFSPDGTRLVFASNRNAKVEGETNVFVAEWVE